jgi:hypothetical protein
VFNFRTFREWVEFVYGNKNLFATSHKCNEAMNVLLLPAAQLAGGCSFGSDDEAWKFLEGAGKTPVALSHAARMAHGQPVLESVAGRAAADSAVDISVFLLDAIYMEYLGNTAKFYLAFVKDDYVPGAVSQVYELMPGVRVCGHVGFVPASVLSWAGQGQRAICATYSEFRRVSDDSVVRGIRARCKGEAPFQAYSCSERVRFFEF